MRTFQEHSTATRKLPRVGQHDKRGQVLILRPQSITHPSANAGIAVECETGVHQERRRRMVRTAAAHRVNEGEFIHARCNVWQQVGAPASARAVLAEIERAFQQLAWLGEERVESASGVLPMTFLQLRFVVEGIKVAHPAEGADVNHAFGLGRKHRRTRRVGRSHRRGHGASFIREQPAQRDTAEPTGAGEQEVAAPHSCSSRRQETLIFGRKDVSLLTSAATR